MIRVFFDMRDAQDAGETDHPQRVMQRWAEGRCVVIDYRPQSLFDGWEFWLEVADDVEIPPWLRVLPWEEPPQ